MRPNLVAFHSRALTRLTFAAIACLTSVSWGVEGSWQRSSASCGQGSGGFPLSTWSCRNLPISRITHLRGGVVCPERNADARRGSQQQIDLQMHRILAECGAVGRLGTCPSCLGGAWPEPSRRALLRLSGRIFGLDGLHVPGAAPVPSRPLCGRPLGLSERRRADRFSRARPHTGFRTRAVRGDER